MAGKKRGLIERLMLGSEKSEGYARASLPSNRWELFWDIFKGRFWKLVIINLLVLLFFIPLFILLFLRSNAIAGYGASMPFAQGFGVGYQAPVSLIGYEQQIVLNVNLMIYLLLPITVIIAAIGVAGGAYVIRNMVWTEGIFVANDFWRGVKLNIKPMLFIGLTYSVLFYLTRLAISIADFNIAVGSELKWLFVISKIFSIVFLIFYSVMTMHMITMAVTYELKFRALLKNSFLFTLGLLPQNAFFLLLGFLPFLLMMLGGFFLPIGIIIILLLGFSTLLLIWTNFCQWSYDKFINDKVQGAKKNRGIYEKVKESDSEALKQYRIQAAKTRSKLNSRPIKPITDDELKVAELPTSFNRDDILRLNESKQAIYDDHARYVEEHKNDPEFAPTEEEAAVVKEKKAREDRIEKAKRELMKREKRR
ncbi:MAG: hypothetical protein IJQ23_03100 [Clostridia bacterium]|nr:hypothetical protein [Clostridia bacterium]